MATAQSASTKHRILDAAEQAFADFGFAAASLRCIVKRADVNLAAVNYHFGSKDALVRAVFARRIEQLTRERLALLDACEAAAGTGPLPLEGVLRAFVSPALQLTTDPDKGGRVFMRLFGRAIAEPSAELQRMLNEQFGGTVRRFVTALRRAVPEMPPATLGWRFQFVVGAMGYVMADPQNIKEMSHGLCDPNRTEEVIEELVAFLAAGLRAGFMGKGRRA